MTDDDTSSASTAADADLVLRARSGDSGAFGELWARHHTAALVAARSIAPDLDADELVREAYTRVHQAVVKGGGPNGAFRAHLFTTIRNTAAVWDRTRAQGAVDELDTVADPDDVVEDSLGRSMTAQSFRNLPPRWQEVLWYTDVEQLSASEVAPLLGTTADGVAQLASLAREGLRDDWTAAHLGAAASDSPDISDRLAHVVLPLVLGIDGAARYTATAWEHDAPVAVMPSSVVESSADISTAAISTARGADHAAPRGDRRLATASLAAMGVLIGAGSAALVIAGVVAAATVVPGLDAGHPVAAISAVQGAGGASIPAEVVPESDIETETPLVIDAPASEPVSPAPHAPRRTPIIDSFWLWHLPEAPATDDESASPAPIPSKPEAPGSGGDSVLPPEPAPDPDESIDPEPETPTESEPPVDAETPDDAEIPDETAPPVDTETPGGTDAPDGVEVPVETEKPVDTETPVDTEKPVDTETPDETEQPSETEKPVGLAPAQPAGRPSAGIPLLPPASAPAPAPAPVKTAPVETPPVETLPTETLATGGTAAAADAEPISADQTDQAPAYAAPTEGALLAE